MPEISKKRIRKDSEIKDHAKQIVHERAVAHSLNEDLLSARSARAQGYTGRASEDVLRDMKDIIQAAKRR